MVDWLVETGFSTRFIGTPSRLDFILTAALHEKLSELWWVWLHEDYDYGLIWRPIALLLHRKNWRTRESTLHLKLNIYNSTPAPRPYLPLVRGFAWNNLRNHSIYVISGSDKKSCKSYNPANPDSDKKIPAFIQSAKSNRMPLLPLLWRGRGG